MILSLGCKKDCGINHSSLIPFCFLISRHRSLGLASLCFKPFVFADPQASSSALSAPLSSQCSGVLATLTASLSAPCFWLRP